MFKAEKVPIRVKCSHRGVGTAPKALGYLDEKECHHSQGQIPFQIQKQL